MVWVMALRSWRTLICHLEAPKGQSNQSDLRDFKRYIIKWSDECIIIQSEYKINYFNNNFNEEIRIGPNPKIRKVGPSDLEDVFKQATWRV